MATSNLDEALEKQRNNVIDMIKACLISVKGDLAMEQLHKDYRELVGSPIPFRELHHATLASFLQSVPHVLRLENRGGKLFVYALSDENTKHISKLVAGQKHASKKSKAVKPKAARHPKASSPWVPPPQQDGSHGSGQQRKHSPVLPPSSVQPSLRQQQYYVAGNFYIPRAMRNTQKQFPPYYEVPPRFNADSHSQGKTTVKSYKKTLEEEARKAGINHIVFRTIPYGQRSQHWVSTLIVGDKKFNSYPEEKSKAEEAEEVVAKKALEHLELLRSSSPLPVTHDFMLSLKRVKELISSQSNGVWWQHVKEKYEAAYQETLPYDWCQKVVHQKPCLLDVNNPKEGLWIVNANHSEQESPTLFEDTSQSLLNTEDDGSPVPRINLAPVHLSTSNNSSPRSASISPRSNTSAEGLENDVLLPPPLKLPEDKFWDVYISYIQSCDDVRFRLIGDEYSVAYESLVTDMELHYMEEKNRIPVTKPQQNGIYVCSHEESWYRVQIIRKERDKDNSVTVFFVDDGDEETIPLESLYELKKDFHQLPCQHVRCSLVGLEFGGRDPTVLFFLQNLALGKPLVAEVVERVEGTLSVVLYDTSTEEDVNINQKVSEEMAHHFVEPSLPREGGVIEVYMTHVTSTGDIYVQIETETYKILESLLEASKVRVEEAAGEDLQIDLTKLYLAKFAEDGEWYRAAPRSKKTDSLGKVVMFFVDYGNSDAVLLRDIRPLEAASELLAKIPQQALVCQLANVPALPTQQWTQRLSQRLVSLVPSDSPLLLKMQSRNNDGVPKVELFKRLHPQNELVSLNATLAMDSTLFSCDGDSNNNSVNKDVLTSPVHSRSRRSSSNSQASLSSGPSSFSSINEGSLNVGHNKEDLSAALKPPEIPKVGDYFDVFVTYAANPSHFAVQAWKQTKKLETLMAEMQEFYKKSSNLHKLEAVYQDGYYAVMHTDNIWYRARVSRVVEEMVCGLFVDYGDCFVTMFNKVQPLWPTFRHLPYQSIKAKLGGIRPKHGDWIPEDTCRFRELVENKEFVSVILETAPDVISSTSTGLTLRLVDTSDPEVDVHIDDILVQEGRALRT
ncbi:tudor domain-containing protein 7-like isoform X2 [Oratosquilla oratoria]|uniref:tudor domain-containing protein 7-like isoform X2 n=1 Tax=Oratosquilla oratoria TaxID=337810 RepID=UPI003F759347